MRKFLEEDGELDAEDVMVVGKLLAKLGFCKREDLRTLGEAFFESMMSDTPPVVVFKSWKVMHHNGFLDEDSRPPVPSCRLTTRHLKEGAPDKRTASSTADPRRAKPCGLFGESDEGTAPEKIACERVIGRPARGRQKKPGTFNPCSLTGRGGEKTEWFMGSTSRFR
jgi:hypothetical protein